MMKKLRKLLRQQEGFTLVELMVAVVILGILMGIGVQQYNKLIKQANEKANDANKKVLENAARLYVLLDGPVREDKTWTWTSESKAEWKDYIDEWPKHPEGKSYQVNFKVEDDKTITVKVSVEESEETTTD